MQFSADVHWSINDFIVASALLIVAGLVIEFVLRKVKNKTYRIVTVLLLFLILFLVWTELAVGIFGTPFAGN